MEKEITYVPNRVLHDTTLPAGARLLYGVILTQSLATGYCASTSELLGDAICVSHRRTQELIAILIKHKLITREIVTAPKTHVTVSRKLYPEKSELRKLKAWIKKTGGAL